MKSLKYYSSHVFQRFTFSWIMLLCFITLGAGFSNVMAQGLSVDNEALSCPGLLQVSVSGGTSPYTYLWEVKDGDGNWIIYEDNQGYRYTGVDDPGSNQVNERRIVGADPGVYRLTAEDQNGITGIVELTLTPPFDLSARTDFEGLICSEEEASGLVLLEFINGFADYNWVLSQGTSEIRNGVVSGSNYLVIEGLSAGVYTLDWTDANLCTGNKNVTIAAPNEPLDLNLNIIQDVSCPGGNDGSVSLNFSGGWTEISQGDTDQKKYMFELYRDGGLVQQWSNTEASNNIVNLEAGNYLIFYTDRVNENNTRRPFSQYNFDSDSYGCTKSQSFTITEPDPFELNLTSTPAVCQGDTNGEMAITPSGGTPTYEINFYEGHFDDPDNPVVDTNAMILLAGSPITNVNTSQEVKDLAAGNYAVLLEDANGCLKAENITIIENPLGQVDPINDITHCSGDLITQVFTTSEATGTTRYEWTNDNTSAGLAASGTGDISFTATNTTNATISGTITVTPFYIDNRIECPGVSETFDITINPEPVVEPQTKTVCSDDPISITLGDDVDGPSVVSYNLISITSNGLTADPNNKPIQDGLDDNAIANDIWTNLTSVPEEVVYNFIPKEGNGCEGDPFTVTVTVNPKPIGVDSNPLASSSEQFSFDPQNNISNGGNEVASDFNWEVTAVSDNLTGASIGETGSGIVTGLITNTSTSIATVEYTVIPTSSAGCKGSSFVITVDINPEPVVEDDQIIGTFCSNQAFGVNFKESSTVAAATYNVTNINSNGLDASAGGAEVSVGLTANDLADDAFTNTTTAAVEVIYTVVPVSSEGVEGESFHVKVTINPEPVVEPQTKTVCSDDPISITLGDDVDGPSVVSYNLISITSNGLTADPNNKQIEDNLDDNAIANDIWTNLTSVPEEVVYNFIEVSR